MKLKIISEGLDKNTKVINVETGEVLENVTSIKWGAYPNNLTECTITLHSIPIEVTVHGIKEYELSNKQ